MNKGWKNKTIIKWMVTLVIVAQSFFGIYKEETPIHAEEAKVLNVQDGYIEINELGYRQVSATSGDTTPFTNYEGPYEITGTMIYARDTNDSAEHTGVKILGGEQNITLKDLTIDASDLNQHLDAIPAVSHTFFTN